MENKISSIAENVESIKVDINHIKTDLALHIYRTQQNEELIHLLRQDLKPVENHVERVNGAFRLLGILTLIAGIVKAYTQLI